MKRRDFVKRTAAAGAALAIHPARPRAASPWLPAVSAHVDFNPGWRFLLGDAAGAEGGSFDDRAWSAATLPHTARIEALVTGAPGSDTYQWQGICWYRRRFSVSRESAGRRILLKFDGAMNVADVWLNGDHLGQHMGGWLPFGFDISSKVTMGSENLLAVRLDNRDNPMTGPKPLAQLDFNLYHGIYRNVHLVIKNALHITDPILADRPASGGVFVTYPEVSADAATVRVQAHVRNAGASTRGFLVHVLLVDADGRVAAESFSDPIRLGSGEDQDVVQNLRVYAPALWSPPSPALYTLHTEVVEHGVVVDAEVTRIGFRHIGISADGFRINGERMFLRGTNRHQEYPYVGYALSDAAQYRDAKKIKDAGFDYIRLSHYAHAPAFMDACDELGIVVMNCIPGWQFFNRTDPEFTAIQYDNCRRLVRRDRNHPCVILWEVSLNETDMPAEFVRTTHAIAHAEYPGDQCYTCGWTHGYDVFLQARQHGGCKDVTDRPCVVSEYGDWEYYAQNAGLQQEAWANLAPDQANSRQLRWHGEAALLQQATNFQEAHNDNRKTTAFADGLWVMYDYNRGYAPDIESSGCMDIVRLPKFSHAFYQSQRSPAEALRAATSGPMVFIASYWTPTSSTSVRVFSNCEEVVLSLDGALVERRQPDTDRISTNLAHPPFTFRLERFQSGTLEAVGYIGGHAVTRHAVRTPGSVARLDLRLDESGRPFATDGKDVGFLWATLRDANGTIVRDVWENVFFGATGDVTLVGANPFSSDAGIASILVQTDIRRPRGVVYALCIARDGNHARVISDAVSAGGDVEPWGIRVTTDGSEPGTGAARYEGPIPATGRVRAALFVAGRRIVDADTDAPKFRIAGSTAPVLSH
jgi:beta-galactosidase